MSMRAKAHLHRSICTTDFCISPSISSASIVMGPTSQPKKRVVSCAFVSAPRLVYGKIFLRQACCSGHNTAAAAAAYL